MFDYPVMLEPQSEGGFVVTFPDIPEAITQGDDMDEVTMRAVDALETALSFYVDDQRPLPMPSIIEGLKTVRPTALECLKLGLYAEMLAQNVRKPELAKRLNWRLPQVDRLLDLSYVSRLDQLEAAIGALGKRIDIFIG